MAAPHFLLVPYAEHGHVTPMLSLASQLAALHCKVTFLGPPTCRREVHDGLNAARHSFSRGHPLHNDTQYPMDSSLLQFMSISDKPHDSAMDSSTSMSSRHKLAELEERLAFVEEVVQKSKASAQPVSCVICDLVVWKWAKEMASRQGVHFAVLLTCSVLTLYEGYLMGRDDKELEIEELLVSGFGMPRKGDPRRFGIANISDPPDVRNQITKFFRDLIEGLENGGTEILVNSFKRLEAPLLPSLESSGLKVRFIGPCFPAWDETDGCMSNKMVQQAGSTFVQDDVCLPWLDGQRSRSVLFVSFGSEAALEEEQVEEIAMGVERSGYKFLWVMRPDAPVSSLPSEGFCRRNSGCSSREDGCKELERGKFVSWVPQRRVLQHGAVGGFLTHSGWNSTIESVAFGVPMLCLPLISDQPMNANLVERHWGVGVRLEGKARQEGGRCRMVVEREEVEMGVRAVMEGRFSEQVSQLQEAARMAMRDVPPTLTSFLNDVTRASSS